MFMPLPVQFIAILSVKTDTSDAEEELLYFVHPRHQHHNTFILTAALTLKYSYFSEDFNFHHSSHCSVLFICAQQGIEDLKIFTSICDGFEREIIKELDAEDLLNVKEKWCVVLKTNDDLFLAASQLQSEALGFKTHKQLKQRWDNYGSCLCPGESTLLPPCHIKKCIAFLSQNPTSYMFPYEVTASGNAPRRTLKAQKFCICKFWHSLRANIVQQNAQGIA
ncbi:hypothetical protein T4C_727 [Trichinella pseudospiralis]|uniref:Uncharacterized protein n=1 Tax=Trichinella pseudospiralis TaxID=6337 RepID=A0A0V1K533_TRIPS|nr:hypothetical protein T4C_727 [Trichinella pseudospiralis]